MVNGAGQNVENVPLLGGEPSDFWHGACTAHGVLLCGSASSHDHGAAFWDATHTADGPPCCGTAGLSLSFGVVKARRSHTTDGQKEGQGGGQIGRPGADTSKAAKRKGLERSQSIPGGDLHDCLWG